MSTSTWIDETTTWMFIQEWTENWQNETSTADAQVHIGSKYEGTSTIALFITLGLIGKLIYTF